MSSSSLPLRGVMPKVSSRWPRSASTALEHPQQRQPAHHQRAAAATRPPARNGASSVPTAPAPPARRRPSVCHRNPPESSAPHRAQRPWHAAPVPASAARPAGYARRRGRQPERTRAAHAAYARGWSGVSGASGTPYAAAVLRALLHAGEAVDLVVSRAARLTLLDETGAAFRDAHWREDLAGWLARGADGTPGRLPGRRPVAAYATGRPATWPPDRPPGRTRPRAC